MIEVVIERAIAPIDAILFQGLAFGFRANEVASLVPRVLQELLVVLTLPDAAAVVPVGRASSSVEGLIVGASVDGIVAAQRADYVLLTVDRVGVFADLRTHPSRDYFARLRGALV